MTNEITPYEIIQKLGLTGLDATICKINPEKYIGKIKPKQTKKGNRSWREAKLSFAYTNRPDRTHSVIVVSKKRHNICSCFYSEKQECIELFTELQNNPEVSLEEAQKIMKDKFNLKSGRKERKSTKKINNIPTLYFHKQHRSKDRYEAQIHLNGKLVSICNCYSHQKDECKKDYVNLYSKKSLDELKDEMRGKYNLIIRSKKGGKTKKISPKKSKLEDFTVDKTGCILHKGKSIRLHYSALNELVQMKKVNGQSDAHIISWYQNTNPKILRMLINNVDTKEYWDLFHKLEDDFCKLRGF